MNWRLLYQCPARILLKTPKQPFIRWRNSPDFCQDPYQATRAPLAWKRDLRVRFSICLKPAQFKLIEPLKHHPGGELMLCIRDHGPHLNRSELKNMFDCFSLADPTRARSNLRGSGLGLAIIQEIAFNHFGRIQAGNHPDGVPRLELLLAHVVRPELLSLRPAL